MKARAKARSWRSPAERDWPRSCTTVSSPQGSRATRSRSPTWCDRLPHGVVGRVGTGEARVVPDRAGEEERLLGDDADLAAQRVQRHRAQVEAVDEHAAALGVVEAVHQLGHRRLARSGRPDEGDRLARGDVEVDVLQHRDGGVVAEGDVVEADRAARSTAARWRRLLGDRGLGLERARAASVIEARPCWSSCTAGRAAGSAGRTGPR